MKKSILAFFPILVLCITLMCPRFGECSETWELVSGDFKSPRTEQSIAAPKTESEMVEIEYGGKLISVDVKDLILMADEDGKGSHLELYDPSEYGDQIESTACYGVGAAVPGNGPSVQEITEREYEEEARARQWAGVIEDLNLRDIDNKALELVKEFGEAKNAVPPIAGVSGSLVITYSTYTPKIVCRPMYVTDVILQPGESVTGVHPGDPVRWSFVPSRSGAGDMEQTHVLIKPLAADISTNVIINTDRRTYQLDLMSSSADFMPSVSFAYPHDSLKEWDSFLLNKKKERENAVELGSGYTVNPEDLHMDYEVRGKDSLRWKPIRVWDDGVKTYIQFKKGAAKRSVEAPALVVYEHKKEILVNYRALEDMYVVDKVFDKGALIAGTGSHQDRVVITRLRGK
ncbi:MAG: P-type conjugative transfer protein TrbG [Synergistaceae bacterium]|nr:P-type conjugative transfer protein TrbG [Synergistaceae bacterium]